MYGHNSSAIRSASLPLIFDNADQHANKKIHEKREMASYDLE